jgi:tetratricopeptide (TPR) repeat protein
LPNYKIKNAKADELYFQFLKNIIEKDDYQSSNQIQDLNQIIQLEPDIEDPNVFYYLASAYDSLKNESQAIAFARKSESFSQKYKLDEIHFHFLHVQLGLYEFKNKNLLKAKKHFQNALSPFCPDDKREQIINAINSCENTSSNDEKKDNSGCFIVTASTEVNSPELSYFSLYMTKF